MVKKRDEYEDEEHLDLGGPYNEQVYPCGCRARVCLCGCDNEPDIVDCALHGAAEEMLGALKRMMASASITQEDKDGTGIWMTRDETGRIRDLIYQVEGKKKGGRDGR